MALQAHLSLVRRPLPGDACERAGSGRGAADSSLLEANYRIIPDGPILFLGAGGAAAALDLARRGRAVTVFEESAACLEHIAASAAASGLHLTLHRAAVDDWRLGYQRWAAIVVLFSAWPTRQRRRLFARIPNALEPGGVFLMEAPACGRQGPRHFGDGPDPEDLRPELEILHLARFAIVTRTIAAGAGTAVPTRVLQAVGIHREPDGASGTGLIQV